MHVALYVDMYNAHTYIHVYMIIKNMIIHTCNTQTYLPTCMGCILGLYIYTYKYTHTDGLEHSITTTHDYHITTFLAI